MERITTGRAAGLGGRKYDLAVAYRIYPEVSKPAQSLPFGDNKLRQAEICLQTFRQSLGPLRVKLWAILDGCPQDYRLLFERHFPAEDLVVSKLSASASLRGWSFVCPFR